MENNEISFNIRKGRGREKRKLETIKTEKRLEYKTE